MRDSIDWVDATLVELSAPQLHDLLKLRFDVFVVEQQCIYPELDGQDALPGTRHLFGLVNCQDAPASTRQAVVAAARILASDDTRAVRIGRIVVAKAYRGTALSRTLMDRVMASCDKHYPDSVIELSAQVGVDGLYAEYGFKIVSADYFDDGIAHRDMRRDPCE